MRKARKISNGKKPQKLALSGMTAKQSSSGEKATVGGKHQSSPGVLKNVTESLQVGAIFHFNEIPDYIEESRVLRPVVIITQSGYNCIEGWHLVQKAISSGDATILCDVMELALSTVENVAIEKVAIRTRSIGGRSSYSEIARNVNKLYEMLSASSLNLPDYTHGGDRKSEGYKANKEDSIKEVLAERLEYDITTIRQFLNHTENLSEDFMSKMVEQKVGKDFYEAAAKNKRALINVLRPLNKTDEEISDAVSTAMLSMHKEFAGTSYIKSMDLPGAEQPQKEEPTSKPPAEPVKEKGPKSKPAAEPDDKSHPASKPEPFKHFNGPGDDQQKPVDIDLLIEEVGHLHTQLGNTLADDSIAVEEKFSAFKRIATDLFRVCEQYAAMEEGEPACVN